MARQDNKRSSTTSLPIQEKNSPANEEKISEKSGDGEPPDAKKICHDTMVTMQIDRSLLPKVLTDDDVVKEMKKDYGNQGILSPTEEALLCKLSGSKSSLIFSNQMIVLCRVTYPA